jgi:hypothetical protein
MPFSGEQTAQTCAIACYQELTEHAMLPCLMPRTREQILEERRQLKAEYGELFESVSSLLFRHDPIGINFEENTDEYNAETGTILPRLRSCESPSDALRVVHEEFVRWFDAATAGPEEHYAQTASEIWQLWQRYRQHAANAQ